MEHFQKVALQTIRKIDAERQKFRLENWRDQDRLTALRQTAAFLPEHEGLTGSQRGYLSQLASHKGHCRVGSGFQKGRAKLGQAI